MKIKHLVMFSGGASSAFVAKWVVDKYGKDDVILFFTDTQWEDDDNYRFMEEVASYIGIELTRVVDGRTPEDVFFEQRFLGNARTAKCSEELKVKQTLIFTEELRKSGFEPVIYFGIGPDEAHRAESLTYHYTHLPLDPIEVRFPMIEARSADLKAKYVIEHEWGIKLPRMYNLGFHHSNCGGKCVRAGMHHFANLYLLEKFNSRMEAMFLEKYKTQYAKNTKEDDPYYNLNGWKNRFSEFEDMEERFRAKFDLNVSMMKKNSSPYTLKQFREEVLEKMSFDDLLEYTKEKDQDTIPCFCSFS